MNSSRRDVEPLGSHQSDAGSFDGHAQHGPEGMKTEETPVFTNPSSYPLRIHENTTHNNIPKKLQTIMGHASIQMTFDVYGHLMDGEGDQKAAVRMERHLLG